MSSIITIFNSRPNNVIGLSNPAGRLSVFPYFRFYLVTSDTLFQSLEIFGIISYQVNEQILRAPHRTGSHIFLRGRLVWD